MERTGNIDIYTGSSCSDWAGHVMGDDYLAFGNVLAGEHVVESMARAFEDGRGHPFSERLL